jgi:hypothetical protein
MELHKLKIVNFGSRDQHMLPAKTSYKTVSSQDLRVFDDGILIQLCFWTLSSLFYLKHNISKTWFCLRFGVEPSQFSPIARAI